MALVKWCDEAEARGSLCGWGGTYVVPISIGSMLVNLTSRESTLTGQEGRSIAASSSYSSLHTGGGGGGGVVVAVTMVVAAVAVVIMMVDVVVIMVRRRRRRRWWPQPTEQQIHVT